MRHPVSRERAQELRQHDGPSTKSRAAREAWWSNKLASDAADDSASIDDDYAALGHSPVGEDTLVGTANIEQANLGQSPLDENVGLDETGIVPPPPPAR